MKKVVIGLVVVAIAGAVAFMKLRPKAPDAVTVEAEAVEARTIVQTVTATGRIQPKTQVNLSADVSGKITHLGVSEGAWVEKGQLLVELDRERFAAAVEVAEANLRVSVSNAELARANLLKAEQDLERARGLFAGKLEPQANLDAAGAVAKAEAARHRAALDQVEQARANLKQAEDDIGKTRIFAPLAGTVSKLNKEVGEIALGSQFQEDIILEISNLNGMEAVVDVDENDIVAVALNDKATIEVDALPGTSLTGEVTEIANSAKQSSAGTTDQKTEFEVKVTILDVNAKLRPGMTASSEIVVATKHDVLGVPIQCVGVRSVDDLRQKVVASPGVAELPELTPDKDGFVQFVFVVDGDRAVVRPVQVGIQSDTHIEIVAGLEAGDRVVTGNYRAISKDLQHGSLVQVEAKAVTAAVVARSAS